MDRRECLDAAAACVLQDRNSVHGEPEDGFAVIAKLWSIYLEANGVRSGKPLSAVDVAAMMSLLKLARIAVNPSHADSWVDLAGYAACGAEVSVKLQGQPRPNTLGEP